MKRHRVEAIDRTYAAVLAEKTPAERAAMADSAHRSMKSMLRSRIHQLHPEWADEDKHRELLRRILGHGAAGYLKACR